MKKTYMIAIFSSIGVITVILIVLGVIFNKTEAQKINGLTNIYDVSINESIAYVSYSEGKPEIYLKSNKGEQLALQLEEDKEILDIAFSPDGTTLLYSETDREMEEQLKSSIHILDVRSFDNKILFEDDSLITEIVVDPKNDSRLFYIKAKTFENYSPIAQARPHNFDVYSYDMNEDMHTQHTKMDQYSISSLQVSSADEIVYVQMIDDIETETLEENFEIIQRVFQIPLNNPEQLTVITDSTREIDIFDFALVPNEDAMIFQSISNYHAGGNFEYDLYYYDWKNNVEEKITNLEAYADRPVIPSTGDKVYFVYDENFTKGKPPKYQLYVMDVDGENITEIQLRQNNHTK